MPFQDTSSQLQDEALREERCSLCPEGCVLVLLLEAGWVFTGMPATEGIGASCPPTCHGQRPWHFRRSILMWCAQFVTVLFTFSDLLKLSCLAVAQVRHCSLSLMFYFRASMYFKDHFLEKQFVICRRSFNKYRSSSRTGRWTCETISPHWWFPQWQLAGRCHAARVW